MHSLDKIGSYVEQVCQQIRWKKAKPRISEEITNHIIDSRDEFIKQGLSENAAIDAAITSTGNAEDIGIQLDRIHRPKPQWNMLIVVSVLLLLGLLVRILIFNDAGRVEPLYIRLIYLFFGIAGMLTAYYADFTILDKYPKTICFSVLGGIIVLITASIVFPAVVDAHLYFSIILLFPVVFSTVIFSSRNNGYKGIVACCFIYLIFCFLILVSITWYLYITISYLFLLSIFIHKGWFGTRKFIYYMLMITPVLLLIPMILSAGSFYLQNIKLAVNPIYIIGDNVLINYSGVLTIDDNVLINYSGVITRELLSNARFIGESSISLDGSHHFGTELFQGLFSNLNHSILISESDMNLYSVNLLTSLITKFGWISFIVILTVMFVFIGMGLRNCINQKSSLGFLISLAVMITFCFQVISNTIYNLGFQLSYIPIPLPLIVSNNFGFILNMILIGLMLSVFRTGDTVLDKNIKVLSDYKT